MLTKRKSRAKPPKLTPDQEERIAKSIKMMLHAHRDCLRNRDEDTTKITFDCGDGYYGEAFGILRGLDVLGYGDVYGAVNSPTEKRNFRWWLSQLEDEVLREEGFAGIDGSPGDNKCEYCFQHYGKDAVRPYVSCGTGGRLPAPACGEFGR